MIFNVCLEPAVIGAAATSGEYAMQALIAMLRGLSANCVLMDFDDARLRNGIRTALRALPPRDDRAELMRVFTRLEDQDRFVLAMPAPDWAPSNSDVQHAIWQSPACGTQLVITQERFDANIETASLATFQHTAFEGERFARALNGRVFAGGALNETDFLTTNFTNALRYAQRIQICDRLLGKKFADNFRHTTEVLLRWLATVLHDPAACEITIHCERAEGRDDNLFHVLRSLKAAHLLQTEIQVIFYANSNGGAALPHDRFLWTNQFAFEIGRGMDFLDRDSRTNRDVSINLKDMREITGAMAHCAGMLTEVRNL